MKTPVVVITAPVLVFAIVTMNAATSSSGLLLVVNKVIRRLA